MQSAQYLKITLVTIEAVAFPFSYLAKNARLDQDSNRLTGRRLARRQQPGYEWHRDNRMLRQELEELNGRDCHTWSREQHLSVFSYSRMEGSCCPRSISRDLRNTIQEEA